MTRATALILAVFTLLGGCRTPAGVDGAGRGVPAPRTGGGPSTGGVPTAGGKGVGWRWTVPAPASAGMPAADDGDVAFTFGHQHLVVLDAKGQPRWQAARLGLRDVAPRLGADLVVVATDDGVAAFRRHDGSKAWDTPLAERANTPVFVGRLVVTSTWEGQLVALDVADGRVAWKSPLPGGSVGPPASDGATVVATWQREHGEAAGAVAVDGANGVARWAVGLAPGGVGGPAVTPDGAVVLVAGDLAAHAIALVDGEERWVTQLNGAGSAEVPPISVDGSSVLVAHRLGGLDLLDSATGRRLWQVSTDGAAVRGGPVVGPEGSFSFPLDDGRLVLAGPGRETELRQAPGRISGIVAGPDGLLVAATRGAAVNTVEATAHW